MLEDLFDAIVNEIEEREKSLFVSLTYFYEVKINDYIIIKDNIKLNFFHQVVFVAIKNGMHDSKGYVFHSPNSDFKSPKTALHVSKLHNMILSYF